MDFHNLVISNPGESYTYTLNITASSSSYLATNRLFSAIAELDIPRLYFSNIVSPGYISAIEGQVYQAIFFADQQFNPTANISITNCNPVQNIPIDFTNPNGYSYKPFVNGPVNDSTPFSFVFTHSDGSAHPHIGSQWTNATVNAVYTVNTDTGPVSETLSQSFQVNAPNSLYGNGDSAGSYAPLASQEGLMTSDSSLNTLALEGASYSDSTGTHDVGIYLYGWVEDITNFSGGEYGWLQTFVPMGYEQKVGANNYTSKFHFGQVYLDQVYSLKGATLDFAPGHPPVAEPPPFSDVPIYGYNGNQLVVENSSFTTYLMYTAPSTYAPSLPVPVAKFQWTAKGNAKLVDQAWVPVSGNSFDFGSLLNTNLIIPCALPSWVYVWTGSN